ncbi:hypothetical protein GF357_01680 [Candidatus Dojkabacteria bacterium]|nr:hypothetical protein [Candidatus Dojkabacteria bacterium]
MKLFKKKKKPYKAGSKVSGFSLASKSTGKSKKKKKSRIIFRGLHTRQIFGFVLIIIALIFSVYVVYQSAQIVLKIRKKSTEGYIKSEEDFIVGFNDVPIYYDKAYGEAEFVFKNNLYNEHVQKFLNEGYSVYRMPVNASISDIYLYYQNVLPGLGWTYVLEIEPGTEGMKYGQYWVKDGVGLRIYSRINDIWYQRLSENDARTGLAEQVLIETEREQILSESEGYDLLPSFPWQLKVPENVTVSYSSIIVQGASTIEDLQERDFQYAHFNKLDTDEEVVLMPYKIYDGTSLYNYARDFSKETNHHLGHAYEAATSFGSAMEVNVDYLGPIEDSEEPEIEIEVDEEDQAVDDEGSVPEAVQQLPDIPYDRILVLLHDDIKVVYVMALVDSDSGSEDFYQYAKENLDLSIAPKYDD